MVIVLGSSSGSMDPPVAVTQKIRTLPCQDPATFCTGSDRQWFFDELKFTEVPPPAQSSPTISVAFSQNPVVLLNGKAEPKKL